MQIDKEVAEVEITDLYLEKQLDDKIQATTRRARMANHELNKLQRLEAEIESIYHTGDQDTNDPIMHMV